MRLLQDVLRLSKETERIEWMDGWIDKQTDKRGDVWLELAQRIMQTKSLILWYLKTEKQENQWCNSVWVLRLRTRTDVKGQEMCVPTQGKKANALFRCLSVLFRHSLDWMLHNHIGENDLYSVHTFKDPHRCIHAIDHTMHDRFM